MAPQLDKARRLYLSNEERIHQRMRRRGVSELLQDLISSCLILIQLASESEVFSGQILEIHLTQKIPSSRVNDGGNVIYLIGYGDEFHIELGQLFSGIGFILLEELNEASLILGQLPLRRRNQPLIFHFPSEERKTPQKQWKAKNQEQDGSGSDVHGLFGVAHEHNELGFVGEIEDDSRGPMNSSELGD